MEHSICQKQWNIPFVRRNASESQCFVRKGGVVCSADSGTEFSKAAKSDGMFNLYKFLLQITIGKPFMLMIVKLICFLIELILRWINL
jgi:hypothetical protein